MNKKTEAYDMISLLVCDLVSKVSFTRDLFWNDEITINELEKREKEYRKVFAESFVSLIRCAIKQDEVKDE